MAYTFSTSGRQLDVQKWSEHVVFCTFWLPNGFAPQQLHIFARTFSTWIMRGSLNKEKYVPINSKIQHRLLGKTPPGHLNLLTFSLEFSGLPKVLMGDWTTKLNSRSRFMINTFKNAYICSFWSPFRTSHSFTFKLLRLIMKKIAAIERNHVGTPRSSKEV